MIAVALLLSAQSVPHAVLDAADQANGAYVQCLFATSRAASASRMSADVFEARLAAACTAEQQAVVQAMTAVLQGRGERNAAAVARRAAEDARRSVLDTYRQALNLQR